jgi:proteasome lid subunit RPN8/RPN11
MEINLTRKQLEAICIEDKIENVAFMLGKNRIITTLISGINEAKSDYFYIVSSEQYQKAFFTSIRMGLSLYGVLHTHQGKGFDYPSKTDLTGVQRFNPHNYRAVYHIDTGRLTLYNCDGIILTKLV